MVEQVLFASPIVAPAAAMLIGVVVAVVLAGRAKFKSAAGTVLLAVAVAGGLAASSRFVTTDVEVVTQRSADLVLAFAAGETAAIDEYLSERLVVASGGQRVSNFDRETMRRGVRVLDAAVEDLSPTVRSPERRGEREIVMELGVRADLSIGGVYPSTWELVWQREGETWRVVRINALRLGGQPADASNFPRTRGF